MAAPTKKSIILSLLAEGKTEEEICAERPDITKSYVHRIVREQGGASGASPAADKPARISALEDLLAAIKDGRIDSSGLQIQITVKVTSSAAAAPAKPASTPEAGIVGILNPIEICRQWGEEVTRGLLKKCDLATLRQIVRTYTPDRRSAANKWEDRDRVIDYICSRAQALSDHGQAFISD